ncbi:MAG: double zinc ribbon domain-containing protein [Mycobacterium leprae]
MLKRLVPDLTLRRAVIGLLVCMLSAAIAAGLAFGAEVALGRPDDGLAKVNQAVSQYGPASPEAAAAVKAMGETHYPKDVVALLDPATGKALAAYPADFTGKTPEEMQLSGGVKLPSLSQMPRGGHFTLRRTGETAGFFASYRTDRISVRLLNLFPWSAGMERGRGGDGAPDIRRRDSFGDRQPGFGGKERGGLRLRQAPGGMTFAQPVPVPNPTPVPPQIVKPQAILLVAAPPTGMTPLRFLAAIFGILSMLGFVLYWLAVAFWVYTDARRRSTKALAWGLLVLLTNLVGLLVYWIVRREERHCPACHGKVERGHEYCTACGKGLQEKCLECGQPLRQGWQYCAKCGAPRSLPTPGDENPPAAQL